MKLLLPLLFFLSSSTVCQGDHGENTSRLPQTVTQMTAQEDLGKQIREGLTAVKQDSLKQFLGLDSLLVLFNQNEKATAKSGFPQMEDDLELLYSATDLLIKESQQNMACLEFLMKLACSVNRIVEFAEYMGEMTPILATQNLSGFLEAYAGLEKEQQECLIENLSYFKNEKEFKAFKAQLSAVSDSRLKKVADQILRNITF